MNKCPYCNDNLEVIDVDVFGYDVLGCEDCDFTTEQSEEQLIDEMSYYV